MADFYTDVPTTLVENLQYRVELRERCMKDDGFRRAVWTACKHDVLFFFTAMCWLFEPRPRFDARGKLLPKQIPFIPWEHQVPAILKMRESLGLRDIAVFKSRGEGFSWIAILMALHDWLFDDMAKVGIVSNKLEKADDFGNMDSLGGKLDWELSKLPGWLAGTKEAAGVRDADYRRNIQEHSWFNYRNHSQINAFAAVGDVGHAGRYKWFLADELAWWSEREGRTFMEGVREATECRLAISTPNGSTGVFYDLIHSPSVENTLCKIRVHWTANPAKNRGLYRLVGAEAIAIDAANNPLHPEYDPPSQETLDLWSRLRSKGFRLDGTIRSPWYDYQCDRADSTPQSIAQELDLDFGGSKHRVFSNEFFDKANATSMAPVTSGTLDYHHDSLEPEWIEDPNGQFKLWVNLDGHKRPPLGLYAVSADIGSGLGGSYTSNSVCSVIDITRMEQVAEFASNTVEQSAFGELCVVVAKWFHDAFLGWEINFGTGFTRRVLELGYKDVYKRTTYSRFRKEKKREVGWHTGGGHGKESTKELMFSDLRRMVERGEFVLRSLDCVRECGEYIRTGTNSEITHSASKSTTDDSSKGQAHGDRVIAIAVGLQMAKERFETHGGQSSEMSQVTAPPPDTLAYRMKLWEQEDAPIDEWDDRSLYDYAHPKRGRLVI